MSARNEGQRRIHFVSGLPRSGSTLLCTLLRQNCRFSTGISSPLAQMVAGLQQIMSGRSEFHSEITDTKRVAVTRSLVEGYFSDIEPSKIVFDTSRMWCSKIDLISSIFPAAKIICCVRSLSWIIDSFERIIRQNTLQPSRMVNYDACTNVYMRADILNHPVTGPVGFSFNSLKEAIYGDLSGRLIVVTYDTLVREPRMTIQRIYEALGEDHVEHNFHDIEYEAIEFDKRLGSPRLHFVRRKVEFVERVTILPPDLFAKFDGMEFWMREEVRSKVTVI